MVEKKKLPRGITYAQKLQSDPDKVRYWVRIMFQGVQYSAGIYDTLADAREAQRHFKRKAMLGTFVPSRKQHRIWREEREAKARQRVKVADYALHWIQALGSGPTPRTPSTIVAYQNTLDVHIIPAIGNKNLASVDQGLIDALLSSVAKDSGPSASRNVARTLRAMYNYAVKEGAAGMTQPPFKVTVPKSRLKTTDEIPTPAEVTLISQHMPEATRLAPILAAVCALRPAETLGLQRRDLHGLDTERPTLTVARQWVQKTRPPSYQAPKYDSVRTVAIPAFLVPQIKEHLATYVAPDPQAPLFVSATDPQKPIGSTAYRNQWVRAIEAAGTPSYVQHSLRHLGLTLLAVVGATQAEVMQMGGHQNAEAAARYQHALRGRDYQLVDALGKEWEGSK